MLVMQDILLDIEALAIKSCLSGLSNHFSNILLYTSYNFFFYQHLVVYLLKQWYLHIKGATLVYQDFTWKTFISLVLCRLDLISTICLVQNNPLFYYMVISLVRIRMTLISLFWIRLALIWAAWITMGLISAVWFSLPLTSLAWSFCMFGSEYPYLSHFYLSLNVKTAVLFLRIEHSAFLLW